MRSIERGSVPDGLSKNRKKLEERYREKGINSWREASIVAALKRDAARKCMYCEGIMGDVSYGAVEHIKPKSRFPDLALEWSNLGYCCTVCNTKKGDYWTDEEDMRFLNPYDDVISDFIDFAGPVVVAKGYSDRGDNTIRELKFATREDLTFSRIRQMQALDNILRSYAKATRPVFKEALAQDVRDACRADAEFVTCLRAHVAFRGFADLLND